MPARIFSPFIHIWPSIVRSPQIGWQRASLIHQLNAVELKYLLEPLDSGGVARQAVEMLDDDHVEVLLSHTLEQALIAISRVFGKARLCSVDKFTSDIEAIACGDLPAE